MTSYVSQYPSAVEFDPAYKKFFEDFYATSDTAEAHMEYVDYFTKDATLVMASKRVAGREEILALRKAMWEKISTRAHKPLQIFPFGPNADEVMLYGTVKYGFIAGGDASKDWAARAHLVKEADGKVKMDFYQVYLVRHPALVRVRVCGFELTLILGHWSLESSPEIFCRSNATYGAVYGIYSIGNFRHTGGPILCDFCPGGYYGTPPNGAKCKGRLISKHEALQVPDPRFSETLGVEPG